LPENKPIRPVIWVGDSKKQLKKMPDDVQDQLGGELYLAQIGLMPPHAKPFKGVGSGVFELKDDYARIPTGSSTRCKLETALCPACVSEKEQDRDCHAPKRHRPDCQAIS